MYVKGRNVKRRRGGWRERRMETRMVCRRRGGVSNPGKTGRCKVIYEGCNKKRERHRKPHKGVAR